LIPSGNAVQSAIKPFIRWRTFILNVRSSALLALESRSERESASKPAQEAGVLAHLCVDAGRTEFQGMPTPTCCAVGPDFPERIDPFTGHLKLL
jgi:peptidyl-tRNA hydrolase